MNQDDQKHAARTEKLALMVGIAMQILSHRTMTILTLLLNAAVCSWAMYTESWPRLAGALLFAVASWCTVNLKPPKGDS